MVMFVTEVGSAAERWLRKGNLWAVPYYKENLGSGSSMSVLIRNPQDSGKYIIVTVVDAGSDGKAKLLIHLDPSISSDGTPISPISLKRPVELTPTFEAYADPSFTPGQDTIPLVIPGGRGVKSVGSREGFRSFVLLEEGQEIIVELYNRDTDPGDASLYLEIYEETVGR